MGIKRAWRKIKSAAKGLFRPPVGFPLGVHVPADPADHAEDFAQGPTFAVDSWGSSGFDAPSDLAEGEVITMDPPLAMHTSGRVAFSVPDIALDLSQNNSPAEMLMILAPR